MCIAVFLLSSCVASPTEPSQKLLCRLRRQRKSIVPRGTYFGWVSSEEEETNSKTKLGFYLEAVVRHAIVAHACTAGETGVYINADDVDRGERAIRHDESNVLGSIAGVNRHNIVLRFVFEKLEQLDTTLRGSKSD